MITTIDLAGLRVRVFSLVWIGLVVNLWGSPVWAASAGTPWGANYFPNVELINQDGQKVRFYDDLVKGKVFAINFIYTHCTDSCPLETAAMRKIYHELGDRMGRDVFFYTVSIDAKRDDPAALKAYAQRYKTGPGWSFLTGREEDVTQIRQKLGMYRKGGTGEVDLSGHSTVILMGSEKLGQWVKRSPFEEPRALARILRERMLRRHDAPQSALARADVTDPVSDTPGAKLFRSDCSVCHGVGNEPGIGPGLAGVMQNRDRNWLKRWIKEPDKLLKGKDPLAMRLFQQYNQVYMPNLKLTDQEVEQLLAYLDDATKPIAQAAR
jgi:protein SCO1/2